MTNKCKHDPRETNKAVSMYHCPECGEMVIAGLEHPDYSKINKYPHNPGSDQAIKDGCKCPVMDNSYGRGSGYVDDEGNPQFWISADCPLHNSGKGR